LRNSTTYKKIQGKRKRLEGEKEREKMKNPREMRDRDLPLTNQAPSLPFFLFLKTQPPTLRVIGLS